MIIAALVVGIVLILWATGVFNTKRDEETKITQC